MQHFYQFKLIAEVILVDVEFVSASCFLCISFLDISVLLLKLLINQLSDVSVLLLRLLIFRDVITVNVQEADLNKYAVGC